MRRHKHPGFSTSSKMSGLSYNFLCVHLGSRISIASISPPHATKRNAKTAALDQSHFVESCTQTPNFSLRPILLHSGQLRTHVGLACHAAGLACKNDNYTRTHPIQCSTTAITTHQQRLRSNNCLAKAGCGTQVFGDPKVAKPDRLHILRWQIRWS